MIECGNGCFHQGFARHIVELGVVEDDLDRLPFPNLCLEVFDHPALDQSCAESPGILAGLHGHHLDFDIEVLSSDLDVFFLGDPVENEVFLDGLAGRRDRVLSDLVFASLDLLGSESGLLHFQNLSSQRVVCLLGDEFFGKVPVGAFGNTFEHLGTRVLALSELGLPFERVPEGVLEGLLVFDSQPIEEFIVEIGQVGFLDGGDGEAQGQRFAPHGNIVGFGRNGDFCVAILSRGDPGHQFVEPLEFGVLEPQDWSEFQHGLLDGPDNLAAMSELEVGDDRVTRLGRAVVIVEVRILQQELVEVTVDILVGYFANRTVDRQPLVVGQVKFRPHLHIEFVLEVPLLGDFDHVDVKIGLVDGLQIVIFGELLEASDKHLLLDLVREFSPESLGDQPRWHVALAKTGHLGRVDKFSNSQVVHRVDITARHPHDDMPEAGARRGDFDIECHLH